MLNPKEVSSLPSPTYQPHNHTHQGMKKATVLENVLRGEPYEETVWQFMWQSSLTEMEMMKKEEKEAKAAAAATIPFPGRYVTHLSDVASNSNRIFVDAYVPWMCDIYGYVAQRDPSVDIIHQSKIK